MVRGKSDVLEVVCSVFLANIFHKGSGSKYFYLGGILVFYCYSINYDKCRGL